MDIHSYLYLTEWALAHKSLYPGKFWGLLRSLLNYNFVLLPQSNIVKHALLNKYVLQKSSNMVNMPFLILNNIYLMSYAFYKRKGGGMPLYSAVSNQHGYLLQYGYWAASSRRLCYTVVQVFIWLKSLFPKTIPRINEYLHLYPMVWLNSCGCFSGYTYLNLEHRISQSLGLSQEHKHPVRSL